MKKTVEINGKEIVLVEAAVRPDGGIIAVFDEFYPENKREKIIEAASENYILLDDPSVDEEGYVEEFVNKSEIVWIKEEDAGESFPDTVDLNDKRVVDEN